MLKPHPWCNQLADAPSLHNDPCEVHAVLGHLSRAARSHCVSLTGVCIFPPRSFRKPRNRAFKSCSHWDQKTETRNCLFKETATWRLIPSSLSFGNRTVKALRIKHEVLLDRVWFCYSQAELSKTFITNLVTNEVCQNLFFLFGFFPPGLNFKAVWEELWFKLKFCLHQ